MAFWKKSEDPWDIDPAERRGVPSDPLAEEPEEPGVLEELAGIFKRKPEPEEEEPPMVCPWCQKPMERGYLYSGRDKLRLSDEKPSAWWGTMGADTVLFCDEGLLVTHRSCWQCKTCRKVVADFPEESDADWGAASPESAQKETFEESE